MNTVYEVCAKYEVLTEEAPFIGGIHSESEYEDALDFVESLMTAIGDNPGDLRWPLFELITANIDKYELSIHPELIVEGDPLAMIRVLMDQHKLRQSELPEIGSQGVVSEVLNGKRQLNVSQIKALADRFNVPSSLFL